MATQITPQAKALAVAPTPITPDAAGNYIVVGTNDRIWLRYTNTSGSIITVTLDDPTSASPESATQFNPDVAVAIPATTGVRVIRLDSDRLRRFRDPGTGRINITYSAVTNLACEAFYL
jgi:hypothetical protein